MPSTLYPVRIDRRVFVTMSDGVRLGLTTYLPDPSGKGPYPAVIESLPYRKDDDCYTRDWQTYAYLAQRGIAGVRVDIRGTGASGGVINDEYSPQEIADTCEVLAWVAEQEWCSGDLGMWGISWGGFSALQTAMLRPPGLKAIVAAHATHDRFASDVHYVGGSLHAAEQGDWPVSMIALNGLPPDPDIVGEGWFEMWIDRLESTPQWLPRWLRHQSRDDYWLHGSPCADYGAIEAATLLIGGWLDGYVDGLLAMLEHLHCPRRAVIGPWGHHRPATGVPAPTYDHLELMARWFGHHLRGDDNGVMDLPLLTAWIRTAPPYDGDRCHGYWRAEPTWPPADRVIWERSLGRLEHRDSLTWHGPQWVGAHAPAWDRAGVGSRDPHADDANSMVFETLPLPDPLDILGLPEVELTVTSDQPFGVVAARLLAISPEGNSHLICRGSRNLAFPDDLSRPVPLEAGTARTVRFSLLACSALIPAGWRLRLAIAGVDFPIVFPPRGAFELGLDAPRSRLVLPVVPPRPESARLDIPESPPPPAASSVDLGSAATWEVKRVDRTTIFQRRATGAEHQPERGGLTYSSARAWSVSVEDDQPNSTRIRSDGSTTLERSGPERSGWSVRTDASLELTTDGQSFLVAIELEAFNDGAAVWRRRWEKSVPREWA